jgi:hypothetical protein
MLRQKGIAVRKTAHLIIATFGAERGYSLLHGDRDFDPPVSHLALSVV